MATNDDALRSAVLHVLGGVLSESGLGADAVRHSLELEPLVGGTGRRSYVARAGGHAWAVRTRGDDATGVLDLSAEAEVMAEAASIGVAPPVVAVDPGAGLLVTEYRAGARSMSAEALRTTANIERIAGLLRRLHSIRRSLRCFDPEVFAPQYLSAAGEDRPLTELQRRFAEEFQLLARHYRARYPSIVLCHNDLVASNVLDDGRLWLIDFEYAVSAAPVLDLAGLAALNDYGREQRWLLAEAYYEESAVPFTPIELDKVVRLVRLVAYFWALAAARTATDPEPYEQFVQTMAAALD